jgi:hypothetical protein
MLLLLRGKDETPDIEEEGHGFTLYSCADRSMDMYKGRVMNRRVNGFI